MVPQKTDQHRTARMVDRLMTGRRADHSRHPFAILVGIATAVAACSHGVGAAGTAEAGATGGTDAQSSDAVSLSVRDGAVERVGLADGRVDRNGAGVDSSRDVGDAASASWDVPEATPDRSSDPAAERPPGNADVDTGRADVADGGTCERGFNLDMPAGLPAVVERVGSCQIPDDPYRLWRAGVPAESTLYLVSVTVCSDGADGGAVTPATKAYRAALEAKSSRFVPEPQPLSVVSAVEAEAKSRSAYQMAQTGQWTSSVRLDLRCSDGGPPLFPPRWTGEVRGYERVDGGGYRYGAYFVGPANDNGARRLFHFQAKCSSTTECGLP
jgi:hypothetical protein